MFRKLLSYFMVFAVMFLTSAFYICFDLEGILWAQQKQVVIGAGEMKKGKDYLGRTAGKGIRVLKTNKDFRKTAAGKEYVTVVPKDIKKTGVYSLARWKADSSSDAGKQAEALKMKIDYKMDYTPFYIITLQDGTKILAQMNRGIARKIARGNKVKLPLGKKFEISETAKKLLKTQCKKEKVSARYVLYTVCDKWEKKNEDAIFWGKIGITIFVFIFAAILFQILERFLIRALFKKNRKPELQKAVEKLSSDDSSSFSEEQEE